MKKCLTTLAILAVAFTAAAVEPVKMSVADVALAGASDTSDGGYLYGEVEGVYIDLSGYATPTCTVTVATSGGSGAPPARTIYTDTISADVYVPIRLIPAGTDGTASSVAEDARIPLHQDTLTLSVTSPGVASNVLDVTTYVYIRK